MLVDGKWNADWQPVQKSDAQGRFQRQISEFREWITPDGAPGPGGQTAHVAQAGRYHLIVAYICPWASRCLMARGLKGLTDVITVSVVDPRLSDQGWKFGVFPGANMSDDLLGATHLHEFYTHADPHVNGRATVPVLWDKQENRIINNESADILRILNTGFGDLAQNDIDLYPAAHRPEIDMWNAALYEPFNNGVYKAGFASSQLAYDEAVQTVFETLDALEDHLSDGRKFIAADHITEVDIRAFVTLVRFDVAYHGLFKTNWKRVADYSHISAFVRRILAMPGVANTVRIDHIKAGYYSIKSLNPSGIVPSGPVDPFAEIQHG